MIEATSIDAKPWTVGRLLTWTAGFLKDRDIEDARLASEVLLAHAAGCRRIQLYTRFDEVLAADALSRFRQFVRRAAAHEPIAYLVEEKEFFSLPFHVTREVLIPRPETETLVEVALDLCRQGQLVAPDILDMGTGSGCIAVTLLVQMSEARATASDISPGALAIARKNADLHKAAGRMRFVVADKLSLPESEKPEDGFDLIVSNPPYIPKVDISTLKPEVRDFEPQCALTDHADGLTFYRHLGEHAAKWLKPAGWVVVEIADDRAAQVIDVMTCGGQLIHKASRSDRVTGLERVLSLRLQGR